MFIIANRLSYSSYKRMFWFVVYICINKKKTVKIRNLWKNVYKVPENILICLYITPFIPWKPIHIKFHCKWQSIVFCPITVNNIKWFLFKISSKRIAFVYTVIDTQQITNNDWSALIFNKFICVVIKIAIFCICFLTLHNKSSLQ